MFRAVSIDDRIPADHPLRAIPALVNPILAALSARFQAMYSTMGRPSIPPERLLRALLLQTLYNNLVNNLVRIGAVTRAGVCP